MKPYTAIFTGLIFLFAHSTSAQSPIWTLADARTHAQQQQDSDQWALDWLANDLADTVFYVRLPMETPKFPVVKYKAASGAIDYQYKFGDKFIKGGGFAVGKHSYYLNGFEGDDTHKLFFNVLVLTDSLDEEEYNLITSRNYPHYLGEGTVLTRTREVDYLCFLTADQHSYALVNSRLFDARLGQTILVAPQQDGSIRYLQLDCPYLPLKEANSYFRALIQEPAVKAFFEQAGNI